MCWNPSLHAFTSYQKGVLSFDSLRSVPIRTRGGLLDRHTWVTSSMFPGHGHWAYIWNKLCLTPFWERTVFGFPLDNKYQFYHQTRDSEQHPFTTSPRLTEMILEVPFPSSWPTALTCILNLESSTHSSRPQNTGSDTQRFWETLTKSF